MDGRPTSAKGLLQQGLGPAPDLGGVRVAISYSGLVEP